MMAIEVIVVEVIIAGGGETAVILSGIRLKNSRRGGEKNTVGHFLMLEHSKSLLAILERGTQSSTELLWSMS